MDFRQDTSSRMNMIYYWNGDLLADSHNIVNKHESSAQYVKYLRNNKFGESEGHAAKPLIL